MYHLNHNTNQNIITERQPHEIRKRIIKRIHKYREYWIIDTSEIIYLTK